MAQRWYACCARIVGSPPLPRRVSVRCWVLRAMTRLNLRQGLHQVQHDGVSRRTGIYELIEVNEELRTAIHEGEGELAMLAVARRFTGIQADGRRRILLRQRLKRFCVTSVTCWRV